MPGWWLSLSRGPFKPVRGSIYLPRTQRGATSAFTRVFDAPWPLRSGALQSGGHTELHRHGRA